MLKTLLNDSMIDGIKGTRRIQQVEYCQVFESEDFSYVMLNLQTRSLCRVICTMYELVVVGQLVSIQMSR